MSNIKEKNKVELFEIKNFMSTIKEKYKVELSAIKKYIRNKYIYKLFFYYGFTINNKFIPLDSNINVYEACFISMLCDIYINNNKLNILEIGLAYGTSTLIILNSILKKKYPIDVLYTIIDMNQSKQWKNIGMKHINKFLDINGLNNKTITIKLIEKHSNKILPRINIKYDIIFIDGSHDCNIVKNDIINSDKLLNINGLIIFDDVLHKGVRDAMYWFRKKYLNYKRISVYNNKFHYEDILYDKNAYKSFHNPITMFSFIKLYEI